MIGISSVGFFASSGGGSAYDSDAQAFFTANSTLTDTAQKNAINQFVLDLKSNSLWTKVKELHLYFLGDATRNSYNLKNPSIFQRTFSSGWTFSTSGALPDGVSAYSYSGLNVSSVFSANSIAFGVYYNTLKTGAFTSNGIFIAGYNCIYSASNTNYLYWNGAEIAESISDSANNGFQQISRENTTQVFRKIKSNSTTTYTNSYTSIPNAEFYIGKSNGFNTYESRRMTLSYMSDGLSTTDLDNFNTITNSLMTTLGINV